jgi:hypothetical protein
MLHYAGVPTVTGGTYKNTYAAFCVTLESCKYAVETGDIANLTFDKFARGEHGKLWDGTNGDDVSRYLVTNQLKLLNNIKGDDRRFRDITLLPIMPQFRTTRHIDGNYTLRSEDAYRHFEDSVCAICDFDRRDYLMEVPYRTLICSGYDNLITAGRSAAAEGYAWDVLRVIPPAIVTGQAAGLAACQAIDTGKGIDEIDVAVLQKKLESQNVMIHFDDALVPQNGGGEVADIGHV